MAEKRLSVQYFSTSSWTGASPRLWIPLLLRSRRPQDVFEVHILGRFISTATVLL